MGGVATPPAMALLYMFCLVERRKRVSDQADAASTAAQLLQDLNIKMYIYVTTYIHHEMQFKVLETGNSHHTIKRENKQYRFIIITLQ